MQAETTYLVGATNIAAMTPDGSNVDYAIGTNIYLWRAVNQSNTAIAPSPLPILDLAISPDGTRAAFGTATAIYTVNLAQGTSQKLGVASVVTSSTRFQFSGDSGYLVNLMTPFPEGPQVYLYSFHTGTNMLISQSYISGGPCSSNSDSLAISPDGRYVAYRSFATNLVPNDTNNVPDVFLYDVLTGGTTLVSVSQFGNRAANERSLNPVFSGDGRTLFFESWASDLGTNDFNQSSDVFALALSPNGVVGATNAAPALGISLVSNNGQLATNQGPTLTWGAAPGDGYQVQFKTNLADPQWIDLNGLETVVGNQGTITDPTPNPTQRFYRLVLY
jgi:Tol biopolymer transport system component